MKTEGLVLLQQAEPALAVAPVASAVAVVVAELE